MNFWQTGIDPVGGRGNAMVEACVSAYAQTVAMCPGDHWRGKENGGRERVTTSALTRILRKPNDYQTISDFLLNATRSLYMTGNAYALALRNDRFEISSLHLMSPSRSRAVVAETGDVFYALAGNAVIDEIYAAPRRAGARRAAYPAAHQREQSAGRTVAARGRDARRRRLGRHDRAADCVLPEPGAAKRRAHHRHDADPCAGDAAARGLERAERRAWRRAARQS